MGLVLRNAHGRFRGVRGALKAGGHNRIFYRFGMLAAFLALAALYSSVAYLASGNQASADEFADEFAAEDAGIAVAGRRLSNPGACGDTANQGAGMAALYMIFIAYLFVGLAIMCDDFFVPSLELISERLNLSEDVAGATFMAAGSSAPELFTSVADAFGPQNSMGVGTIVGSAMFNILVIVALASAVTKTTLAIDWRPLARDATFYTIAIFIMYAVSSDGEAHWWEGLIMIGCYMLYVGFMFINQRVFDMCARLTNKVEPQPTPDQLHTIEMGLSKLPHGAAAAAAAGDHVRDSSGGTDSVNGDDSQVTPLSDNPTAADTVVTPMGGDAAKTGAGNGSGAGGADSKAADDADNEAMEAGHLTKPLETEDEEENEGLFTWPDTWGARLWKIFVFPYLFFFTFTIPPCGEKEWEKWYVVSFIMSILWIGALCWGMVEFASSFGCIADIEPPIMGIVVLAVGTSIPDAIGSMIVAREGEADMAIANAVGSNVFDILLGLGLPWFLASVTNGGIPNPVNTRGLLVGLIILVGTVVLFVGTIVIMGFRMNSKIGWAFLAFYIIFITYTLLAQYCVLPINTIADCSA